MSTMADVAKLANVSLSTVSYALNGTRPISEETRQRIFAAMKTLGYRPHALARALASKRSHIIALHFPTPERGVGPTEIEFVSSASNTAIQHGYQLLLWSFEVHDLESLRQLTQQGLVDGVVAMEVHLHDDRINLFQEIGLPFSLIGHPADTTDLWYVDTDFEQAACEAISYLISLGHTQIAFLNQSQSIIEAGYGPAVRAQASFAWAMQKAGLENAQRFCSATPAEGYAAFDDLLAEWPELTALVSINDRAIPGVIQAITDRHWRIPDDFSIVVLGSSAAVAELMFPALTTAQPLNAELGRLGVELLIQQIEGQEPNQETQLLLRSPLVIRGSSGPRRGVLASTGEHSV
ncbi:MAG: LacI family DNA-binding transcriptional regulator [Anaerolineae bacterium]|nr:LacI family DNA-binding transcriptional regulator [Anaerolineae bacterium]